MKHTHNKHGGMIDCEGCQPKKAWKPEHFETVYTVDTDGVGNFMWQGTDVHQLAWRRNKDTYFRTKALATAASKAIKSLLKILPHS